MTEVVLFSELLTDGGQKIGVARLNSEKSLNALSLPMIQALTPQLQRWAADPSIVCVWLEGAGDKAFCAGGDIVAMYQAMAAQPGELVDDIADFFSQEYRLDYSIHQYPKPFIVWGHGIVMGGGMGLMNGGSHRIVTERSLLAMPEVTIGLYPDVGATYFLNKMPAGCGLFLGLTGAQINASDALFLGLADQFVASSRREEALLALQHIDWQTDRAANDEAIRIAFAQLAAADQGLLPVSPVQQHLTLIQQLTTGDSVVDVVRAITSLQDDDPWLQRAAKTLQRGCPMTAHIVWNQLQHGADLSLADCFRLELTLSVQCAVRGDFVEGIRALLIDKDKQPRWQHSDVAAVDEAQVDDFFVAPWPFAEHPLRDL